MADTGLGVALRVLRDRRTFSTREIGKLADIDHAYIHRLESGEKTNPSTELIEKLISVLKVNARDAAFVRWLCQHPESNPDFVTFALNDSSVEMEEFTMAAGVSFRGQARPDPATLLARVRRALSIVDDE